MIDFSVVMRLMECFPGSIITSNGEFIAYPKTNIGFSLMDCVDEKDIKCKVIEWFSRSAYKSTPFKSDQKNYELHEFMLSGINRFLGFEFSPYDIVMVYTYLGNRINHAKTLKFIESGYDRKVLEE